MDDKQIDKLINRALQEEHQIPEGLSQRLEKQIDAWATTKKKQVRLVSRRHTLYLLAGIAASILLCLGIFQPTILPIHPKHVLTDTYTNPQDAAAAAQKALLFMSQNLNKGIDQAQEAREEINKVNSILNKHLKD